MWKAWKIAAAAAAAVLALPCSANAQTTLKVVMHSDLKIVDPIWTTAYITRNHGYMVYDTLFAMDEKGEIKPQMVDKYDVSADKLTYIFTLRDGLTWHDGAPVTAEDCVASIKRWAAKDSLGQKRREFDAMFEAKRKKLTQGDELPPGVLKMVKVFGSLAVIESTNDITFWPSESLAAQRLIEATQSSAVTGLPSCHSRPSRRVKVQVSLSAETSYLSTICGCGLRSASTENSVS